MNFFHNLFLCLQKVIFLAIFLGTISYFDTNVYILAKNCISLSNISFLDQELSVTVFAKKKNRNTISISNTIFYLYTLYTHIIKFINLSWIQRTATVHRQLKAFANLLKCFILYIFCIIIYFFCIILPLYPQFPNSDKQKSRTRNKGSLKDLTILFRNHKIL